MVLVLTTSVLNSVLAEEALGFKLSVELFCSVTVSATQFSIKTVLLSPTGGCEDCNLSVGLKSTRISQKPQVQTLQNYLYMLPVTVARSSSDDNAILYVLPVLWMT